MRKIVQKSEKILKTETFKCPKSSGLVSEGAILMRLPWEIYTASRESSVK
jgi:hypothetical protein